MLQTTEAANSAGASLVSAVEPRVDRQPGRVDCAVIVVTYNNARDIVLLLDSLPAASQGLSLRILIVDNGSVDGTLTQIRGRADVTCIENDSNLGYAGAINVGRKWADECSALVVLNPDLVLEPGALRRMFAELADPEVGMVVPMMLDWDGNRFPSLRREPTLMRAIGDGLLGKRLTRRPNWLSEMVWEDRLYHFRHSIDWATGAALLISRACDDAVGPWDERFFLFSEETDYAARTREAGFQIVYQPSARVRHRGGGSGKSGELVALNAVNRIRYMEKYRRWPKIYRMAVVVHEALRARDPDHRRALGAVLRRGTWESIIRNLQVGNDGGTSPARKQGKNASPACSPLTATQAHPSADSVREPDSDRTGPNDVA